MTSTSVVVADDHAVVRHGLRALLQTQEDLEFAGEAADGVDALKVVERVQPDVLILDLLMPGLHGIDVIRAVPRASPRTRVLVLSMYADESYVLEAMKSGALGYVLKDAQADELLAAVRRVASGQQYLCKQVADRALDLYVAMSNSGTFDLYGTLTSREREVLHLAAEGKTNPEIAEKLAISPRTAETHRFHLMRKLGLRNHTELVLYAVKIGIVKVD